MRIVLTTHTLTPEFIGGREEHVRSLAKELSKKHDVVVVAGSARKEVCIEKGDYEICWVPSIPLKLPGGECYRIVPKFARMLKKYDADIIHSHEYGHFTTDVANFHSKLSGTPLVLTVHGHSFSSIVLRCAKALYDITLGAALVANSRKIICISKTQEMEMKGAFGALAAKKTVVIPNAISPSKTSAPRKNKADGDVVVFSMGRLAWRKGFHILVEASKHINEDTRVIIAGSDHGERARLQKRITSSGLEKNVRLLDELNANEKNELMRRCDVFALPSLYEGLPTTLLEALSCCKPVVASDLPGVRAVVRDGVNGFLVEPGSPMELAERINMLARDAKLRKRMGRNGPAAVADYDWRRVAKSIVGVYEEVLHC